MLELLLIFIASVALILGFIYFATIGSYCYAWLKMPDIISDPVQPGIKVSIIVAARNEENNIENCLQALLNQSYSKDLYEIIIVDDFSTDTTYDKAEALQRLNKNIVLIHLTDNGGKKEALAEGIKRAKAELIITTDADCVMKEQWLQTMVNYYNKSGAKMIVGPVAFQNEKTVFDKLQSLEFISLIASGGASLHYNKAILCNGANLAYSKKAYDEVAGFEKNFEVASGDDVLLMYKIKDKYPGSVKFLKNKGAIVFSLPKKSLKEFYNQRKRWASKGFKVLNTETKFVSVTVLLFNFLLLLMLGISVFNLINPIIPSFFLKISLILFGIKCFIDFLLLFLASAFFDKKKLLIYFLPEQFLYIIYVVVVGLFGNFGKYEWKGRELK